MNRQDIEKACKVARPQIMKASKHDHEGVCTSMSSNKGSMQTNRRDFEKTRKSGRPQIMEASKLGHEGAHTGMSLN